MLTLSHICYKRSSSSKFALTTLKVFRGVVKWGKAGNMIKSDIGFENCRIMLTTQLSRCCLVPFVMLGRGNLCCVGGHNPDKSECVAPGERPLKQCFHRQICTHKPQTQTLPSLTLLARKGTLPDSGSDDDDNYARTRFSTVVSDGWRCGSMDTSRWD